MQLDRFAGPLTQEISCNLDAVPLDVGSGSPKKKRSTLSVKADTDCTEQHKKESKGSNRSALNHDMICHGPPHFVAKVRIVCRTSSIWAIGRIAVSTAIKQSICRQNKPM